MMCIVESEAGLVWVILPEVVPYGKMENTVFPLAFPLHCQDVGWAAWVLSSLHMQHMNWRPESVT